MNISEPMRRIEKILEEDAFVIEKMKRHLKTLNENLK